MIHEIFIFTLVFAALYIFMAGIFPFMFILLCKGPDAALDAFFKKKVIHNCDGDAYLHRWFLIRTKYLGLFIHKFVRSDEDRALHDHPWPFLVIPIWQGYIEHYECHCSACNQMAQDGDPRVTERKRVYPILGTRLRAATYRHRVELLTERVYDGMDSWPEPVYYDQPKPSWSLFFRFQKYREWGFWENGKTFINNITWWKEKCE